MSPRRYQMTSRAAATAETRERIVSAAMAIHAQKGLLGTSWEEIADQANVAPATVYRHFPSLAELIPACTRSIFAVVQPPTIGEASAQFAQLASPSERLEHLIRESCLCYQRGAGWLHAARCEAHIIPAMGDAVRRLEATLTVLVRAALGKARVSHRTELLLRTLIDFPFWKSLIDTGMPPLKAQATIAELVRDQLQKEGIVEGGKR